jgi:hypothetical protein
MAPRDPNKSARNRIIKTLTNQLRDLLPLALAATGLRDEKQVNAVLGSKNDEFFDLKNDVINSQEEFVSRWLEGLKRGAKSSEGGSVHWIWKMLGKEEAFREYTILFLKRSYLNHFDELSKNRPEVDSAEIWIGQENASYGLLVSPRFRNCQWENDKSEIRAFTEAYWSIGHVLRTGLVVPHKEEVITFKNVNEYLNFFLNVLVRNSGSPI